MRPSVEEMQRRMNEELSLRSRVGYTALLLVGLGGAGLIGSLLLTEPSLVMKTRVAFGVLIGISLSWAVYAAWVLTRRRVMLAGHQIVAGRMAVAFSAVFVIGTALVGMYAAGAFGVVMLAIAIAILVRARRRFAKLMERRRMLERSLVVVLLIAMTFGAGADVVVTETSVRVPEIHGTTGGTIELAVVRVVRGEKPSPSAGHSFDLFGSAEIGAMLTEFLHRPHSDAL